MNGSGRLSSLVTDGTAAATTALDSEIEVLGVPVDLDHRAVLICIAGDTERLVLKVTHNATQAQRERTMLTALASRLPVPEIRFATEVIPDDGDSTNGVFVTGLSYLDGDPIDHRQAPDEGWNMAAAALRTIHGLDATDLPPAPTHPDNVQAWAESLADEALALGLIDADVGERFRVVTMLRDQQPAAPVPIHGDASAQHFLQRRGSLSGVIDFGDAGLGDPAADLAVLTLWAPDRIRSVVDAYCTETPTPADDLIARIAFHRPLRQLAAAIWNEQNGFSPKPFVVALYEELLKPVL